MKHLLTLTTLAGLLVVHVATAQQTTFSFGKTKTVEQLASNGWDFSNVNSIKNFIYVKSSLKQNENFTVMATPFLDLNANDAVQIKYRVADAVVAVYAEDVEGKLTRIAELAPKASMQSIIIPQGGRQRIIVKVEKSQYAPANLVINSISFSNYKEMAYKTFNSHDMSIKKMQDTPDQLMEPAPLANITDNNATSASAVKR